MILNPRSIFKKTQTAVMEIFYMVDDLKPKNSLRVLMQSHMHNMLIKIKRKSENGEKKKNWLREKNGKISQSNPLIFIPEIVFY